MNCKLTLEKTLDGYTNMTITTPLGRTFKVELVARKEVKSKLYWMITQEYKDALKSNSSEEVHECQKK